jgi:hypothetical protein
VYGAFVWARRALKIKKTAVSGPDSAIMDPFGWTKKKEAKTEEEEKKAD